MKVVFQWVCGVFHATPSMTVYGSVKRLLCGKVIGHACLVTMAARGECMQHYEHIVIVFLHYRRW
jgi:hypothetical protein